MKIPGTNIPDAIVPNDSNDTYGTHNEIYGIGGWRTVSNLAARDAITTQRRVIGMLVNVLSNSTVYQLVGGTTNSHWQVYNAKASISTLSDVFITDLQPGQTLVTDGVNWFNANASVGPTSGASISGSIWQGALQLDTTNQKYTIYHSTLPSITASYPIVSLQIPTSADNLLSIGILNRKVNSFDVVLSQVPNVLGYYINWSLNMGTGTSIGGGGSSTPTNIIVGSGLEVVEDPYQTFTITANGISTQIVQLSGYIGDGHQDLLNLDIDLQSQIAQNTIAINNISVNSSSSMWFNVKNYGASGDGLHNDRQSIQLAINAAQQNGGGIIYIPSGDYNIIGSFDGYSPSGSDWVYDGPIQNFNITSGGLTFLGDGIGKSRLISPEASSMFGAHHAGILNDLEWNGLSIINSAGLQTTWTTNAIFWQGARAKFKNCEFKNWAIAIYGRIDLQSTKNTIIEGCRFVWEKGRESIGYMGTNNWEHPCIGFIAIGDYPTVINNTFYGIEDLNYTSNINTYPNIVRSPADGLGIHNDEGGIFSNNTILNNGVEGIFVASPTTPQLDYSFGQAPVVISNNIIDGITIPEYNKENYGIFCNSRNNANISDNSVSNCTVGIAMLSNGTIAGGSLSNNTIHNCFQSIWAFGCNGTTIDGNRAQVITAPTSAQNISLHSNQRALFLGSPTNCTITNNTLIGPNDGFEWKLTSLTSTLSASQSIVYLNDVSNIVANLDWLLLDYVPTVSMGDMIPVLSAGPSYVIVDPAYVTKLANSGTSVKVIRGIPAEIAAIAGSNIDESNIISNNILKGFIYGIRNDTASISGFAISKSNTFIGNHTIIDSDQHVRLYDEDMSYPIDKLVSHGDIQARSPIGSNEGVFIKTDFTRPRIELISSLNNNAVAYIDFQSTSTSGAIVNYRTLETRYRYSDTSGNLGQVVNCSTALISTGSSYSDLAGSYNIAVKEIGNSEPQAAIKVEANQVRFYGTNSSNSIKPSVLCDGGVSILRGLRVTGDYNSYEGISFPGVYGYDNYIRSNPSSESSFEIVSRFNNFKLISGESGSPRRILIQEGGGPSQQYGTEISLEETGDILIAGAVDDGVTKVQIGGTTKITTSTAAPNPPSNSITVGGGNIRISRTTNAGPDEVVRGDDSRLVGGGSSWTPVEGTGMSITAPTTASYQFSIVDYISSSEVENISSQMVNKSGDVMTGQLEINFSGKTLPSWSIDPVTGLKIVGPDGAQRGIATYTHGINSFGVRNYMAEGTVDNPTALTVGRVFGQFSAFGMSSPSVSGSTRYRGSGIVWQSADNWTDTYFPSTCSIAHAISGTNTNWVVANGLTQTVSFPSGSIIIGPSDPGNGRKITCKRKCTF
jgi:hypothetical protein